MKILLPDALPLNTDIDGVETVVFAADEVIPEEHRDADVLVVWGISGPTLAQDAKVLPNLKLAQSLAAGPDNVLNAGFAPEVKLAGGVGLHTATVTEHTLAIVLNKICRLPQAAAAQAEKHWDPALGGVRPLHEEGRVATLIGANVVIWGFGSIGQNLAKILTALGASVRGVATKAGERAGFPVVAHDDVDAELAQADVLIMLLPGTPETKNLLDARRLALLPAHAMVVNAGRGTTIDEDALVDALNAGRLGGACLDVTAVEPLPAESPLWSAKNCTITPHAAGGRPVGADELIAQQLKALQGEGELRNEIKR